MSSSPRKSSIQPRPTKASLLRLQKQQVSASGLVTTASPITEEPKPVSREQRSAPGKPNGESRIAPVGTVKSRAASAALNDSVGASAGVKAFMAQQRARMPTPTSKTEEEPSKKKSNFMTGAQRYGGGHSSNAAPVITETRKIQVVIKQAKSLGKLDISSRGLTKIPEEVLKMYHTDPNSIVVDFTSSGDAWYDSVDLTRVIAGDNAITEIDERLGNEFGALKQIDFRNNKLETLPATLIQLQNLTSVLMPYNHFKKIPDVLFQLKQLKELNLSHNQIQGKIVFDRNVIENLDLSYNEIEGFESLHDGVSNLVKLNLSHNQIDTLPPSFEGWVKLQELQLNQNKLHVLFPSTNKAVTLPALVRLYAGNNRITAITEKMQVSMPKLIELSLMTNTLQEDGLAGLHGAPNLHTLDISSNQLQIIPASVTSLLSLRRLDIRGNQLHALPYELGKLSELKAIQCEGNPMRSFASMSQTQLIASLRSNYQQQQEKEEEEKGQQMANDTNNDDVIVDLSSSFTQKVSLTKKLDLSNNQLTELPSESMKFTEDIPGTILLDHNEFTLFPSSLRLISNFIVQLNLEHNRLTSFNFAMQGVVFTSLKTLKLSNNRLKLIECASDSCTSFPKLEELVLNHNALTVLPENLAKVLPSLKILSASSNRLDNITDQSFGQGLETLDLSNNDIGYLPPGLSAIDSLKELVVFGNRFRVPRPNIVEQGTKAILEFLKRRHNAAN